jgi:hypothetical protein
MNISAALLSRTITFNNVDALFTTVPFSADSLIAQEALLMASSAEAVASGISCGLADHHYNASTVTQQTACIHSHPRALLSYLEESRYPQR